MNLLMYMQGILACPGKVQINDYKLIPISFLSFFCIVKLEIFDIVN